MCPLSAEKILKKIMETVAHTSCLCCTMLRTIAVFALPAFALGVALGWALR